MAVLPAHSGALEGQFLPSLRFLVPRSLRSVQALPRPSARSWPCSRPELVRDALGDQVAVQALVAAFPAVAAVLDAAGRRLRDRAGAVVDRQDARLEARDQLLGGGRPVGVGLGRPGGSG